VLIILKYTLDSVQFHLNTMNIFNTFFPQKHMFLLSNKYETITLCPYIRSSHKWSHPQITPKKLGRDEDEHHGREDLKVLFFVLWKLIEICMEDILFSSLYPLICSNIFYNIDPSIAGKYYCCYEMCFKGTYQCFGFQMIQWHFCSQCCIILTFLAIVTIF
jgi:hypothetical protein